MDLDFFLRILVAALLGGGCLPADAAGATGMILTKGSVDIYDDKTVRDERLKPIYEAVHAKFDEIYPKEDVIRIICDNHSAHKSREVQNYLATCPEGRFLFVFTPKHGSWLNLIESFFSKMIKQMLKGIRVNSKKSLLKESISISTRLTLIPWSITGLISSTKSLKMKPRAI